MRINYITCCIILSLCAHSAVAAEENIEFNTDVLDLKDQKNIDLNRFSRAGYVMPGEYALSLHINNSSLQEENVRFVASGTASESSEACLTPDMVNRFGFKDEVLRNLTWWHNGECLNTHGAAVKGMVVRGVLSTSTLFVSIPQAYLEYTSSTWDPPFPLG